MLLIGEVLRLVGQTLGYAVAQRRVGLLIVLVVAALVILATTTVTVVGPVAIYPFL